MHIQKMNNPFEIFQQQSYSPNEAKFDNHLAADSVS